VRLVLPRTGVIEARAPFAGRAAPVQFFARGAGGQVQGQPSMRDGLFRVAGLDPGTYTLVCTWDSLEDLTLAEVADVVVRPGETNRDARFNPLDLTGSLHALVLEARAPEPVPPFGRLLVREPEGTRSFETNVFFGRTTTLVVPWPVVDLELRAEGLRTLRVARAQGEALVTLEPGILLGFALDAASLAALGGRGLALEVAREGVNGPPSVVSLDRDGRGTLRVGEPGRYSVQGVVEEKRPGLLPAPHYCALRPIEVRDGTEAQSFTLVLDESALRTLGL
jgi:hypothetical protein